MKTQTKGESNSWREELVRTAATQHHEWIDEDEMPHILASASLKGISVQTMLACRDLFHQEEHFHYAIRRAANHGKARILLVDPDDHHRNLCEKILRSSGFYQVVSSADVSEALTLAASFKPQMLVTEMTLTDEVDGIHLKDNMEAALGERLPTLILEKVLDETRCDAVATQGFLHLRKPVESRALLHCIESLLATLVVVG